MKINFLLFYMFTTIVVMNALIVGLIFFYTNNSLEALEIALLMAVFYLIGLILSLEEKRK